MHPALCISEILFNIFSDCRTDDGDSELFSLARTCRTFKGPALDLLWEELDGLMPLAACLPGRKNLIGSSLTQAEWNTLRNYTHRIRSIRNFHKPLDQKSFKFLSETHMAEPLFPNLRSLQFKYTATATPLVQLALPSLVSLYIELDSLHSFQHHLNSFPRFSPNLRTLCLRVDQRGASLDPNYTIRWQNLQIVDCPRIALQLDALVHLSGMPALTRLAFRVMLDITLLRQITSSNSRLVFSDLRHLTLNSVILGSVSRFLSSVQLPATTNFVACIGHCPCKQVVSIFLNSIQTCGAGYTIQKLQLTQSLYSSRFREQAHPSLSFDLDDLLSCMAFSNLRRIEFNIGWTTGLTDHELSALALAWPHLESLINHEYEWGWNTMTAGGTTLIRQAIQPCQ